MLYPCYSPLPLLLRGWGRRSVVWDLLTCSRTSSLYVLVGRFKSLKELFTISGHTLQNLFRQRADILRLWIPSKLHHCPHGLGVYKWERRWEWRGLIASAILISRSANKLRHFRIWYRYAATFELPRPRPHRKGQTNNRLLCAVQALLHIHCQLSINDLGFLNKQAVIVMHYMQNVTYKHCLRSVQ